MSGIFMRVIVRILSIRRPAIEDQTVAIRQRLLEMLDLLRVVVASITRNRCSFLEALNSPSLLGDGVAGNLLGNRVIGMSNAGIDERSARVGKFGTAG